jgi:hypothetical protein
MCHNFIIGKQHTQIKVSDTDMNKFWSNPDIFVPDITKFPGRIREYRLHVQKNYSIYTPEVLYIKNELRIALMDGDIRWFTITTNVAKFVAFRGKTYFDEIISNPALIKFIDC